VLWCPYADNRHHPDVWSLVQAIVKERGIPFKQALSDAIRAGANMGRLPNRFVQTNLLHGR
jgi:hypothetical protein